MPANVYTTAEIDASQAAQDAAIADLQARVAALEGTPPPQPAPTATLSLTPASITAGQSSTLQWQTTNAASATLDGATVPANGSQLVSPTASTTYTLVASNSTGSVTVTATLSVSPAPPPPGDVPPVGSDVFIANETRYVTADWNVASVHIEAGGVLEFLPNVSAKIKARWIDVHEGGAFRARPSSAAVTHIVELANLPGNGFRVQGVLDFAGTYKDSKLRLAADVLAGQMSLTLAAAPIGWQVGDLLVLPDTHQWPKASGNPLVPEDEIATIGSISGNIINLAAPLAFNHKAARNGDGNIVRYPHVGNLTRNVKIKSESPTGNRGYVSFVNRADVTCQDAEIVGTGQTMLGPIDASNPENRYPVTFLNLYGPVGGQPNGYSSCTFVGNSIYCLTTDHPYKWGIGLRDSHYALISDNVLYNWAGSGIATAQGNETENMIDGNFICRVRGIGDREGVRFDLPNAPRCPGDEGMGIWMRGCNSRWCNNVVSGARNLGGDAAYPYKFYLSNLGSITIPLAVGEAPSQVVDGQGIPILEFDGNEAYGCENGISIWEINAHNTTPQAGGISTLRNTVLWNIAKYGFYGYPMADVQFSGWTHYGDKSLLWNEFEGPTSIWFGDYMTKGFVLRNAHIEGCRTGFVDPYFGGSETVVENSYFRNAANFYISSLGAPGSGGSGINRGPKKLTIRNCTHGDVTGWNLGQDRVPWQFYLQQRWDWEQAGNLIALDEVYVENHQGVVGQNYRLYYNEQVAAWVWPMTLLGYRGAAELGLTNQQNWDQHAVALAGAIAPASATTEPGIHGLRQ